MSPPDQPLAKEKRHTKTASLVVDVKRSSSSPQIHGMVQGSDSSSPPGDKRRNKLGYQRTTIACGMYLWRFLYFQVHVLTGNRSLSKKEDSMSSPVARRPAGSLRKLYTAEEGMQLLPCRSTAPTRAEAERVKSSKRHRKSIGIIIAFNDLWTTSRNSEYPSVFSLNYAIDSRSWRASNEATTDREFFP